MSHDTITYSVYPAIYLLWHSWSFFFYEMSVHKFTNIPNSVSKWANRKMGKGREQPIHKRLTTNPVKIQKCWTHK